MRRSRCRRCSTGRRVLCLGRNGDGVFLKVLEFHFLCFFSLERSRVSCPRWWVRVGYTSGSFVGEKVAGRASCGNREKRICRENSGMQGTDKTGTSHGQRDRDQAENRGCKGV